MKRILIGVLVAAVAALGSATVASASDGATVTHFTAAYPSLVGDFWTCSGSHIVKSAPKPFIKDSETCVISGNVSTYYAGTFASGAPCPPSYGAPPGNECGSFPPVAGSPGTIDGLVNWFSDFNGVFASSWSITITRNSDGTFTAQIDSYYSS